MKHLITKSLLTGLFSLLLVMITACEGNGSDSKTDGDANKDNDNEATSSDNSETTLTLLIDNDAVLDGIEAVAEDIEEKFNIVTDIELRPSGTEGDNIVKTRLATGEMTDLNVYNSGSLFKALNPEEYFVDLSDEDFIDRIEDTFIETVSVDGAIYGVPSGSSSAGGWMYNKEIYEELDLEVPHTWDELMENNEIIKEAGKTPVIASYKDTYTSQVILLGDYYNVHTDMPEFAEEYTANQVKFADTPIALRGFEKIQELHEADYFNDEESSTSYEDALEMLATGEAAHYPMLTSALSAINSNHPDEVDSIGFFGQPGDDPDNHGLTAWMPGGVYINKESEHVDAAKQWVEYFVSDEGLETYMSAVKAEGPYMIEGIDLPDDAYEAVKDMAEYIDADKAASALEFYSPLKGPNLEQITVEVGLGMVTAEEGAEKYDSDVERQAQQLDLEGW